MTSDYNLNFPKPVIRFREVTGNLPENCRYPVTFAQRAFLYEFEGAELICQQLYYDTFRIDVFQLDAEEPFPIAHILEERRIFFNFILNGHIRFESEEGTLIADADACSFHLCSESPGSYLASCSAGSTDLAVVSLLPGWVESVVDTYPNLKDGIEHFFDPDKDFDVLPQCRIDTQIKNWLYGIRDFDLDNGVGQQYLLSLRICQAFDYYEKLLMTTSAGKMHQIKRYIDKNCASPAIDIPALSGRVYLSERTVMRKFKQEYGLPIRTYYSLARLKHAHRQIEKEKRPIKEVCEEMGYEDLTYFRRIYRKYLKQEK